MADLPRPLLAIARSQRGLLTASDLQSHAVGRRARTDMVASGMLVAVHKGVYRVGSHPTTFEQRCEAALLFAPDAVVSGPTAGRLWGLRKVMTDDVHVLAKRTIHLREISAHTTDLLGDSDITERHGLRVLRPPRLLCDLAWHLDDAALESVFEQMLERGMLSIDAARRAARAFCTRGRPGSVRLARVLDGRPAWLRPVDSDVELRLWRALADAGLPMERQFRVELDSGIVYLDLAEPALRFGIEVDHVTWHAGRLDVQRDKRRDRELTRHRWTICRVTDADVEDHLHDTVRQLAGIASTLVGRSSGPTTVSAI
jgi:very-short-patch-repair endonuclease